MYSIDETSSSFFNSKRNRHYSEASCMIFVKALSETLFNTLQLHSTSTLQNRLMILCVYRSKLLNYYLLFRFVYSENADRHRVMADFVLFQFNLRNQCWKCFLSKVKMNLNKTDWNYAEDHFEGHKNTKLALTIFRPCSNPKSRLKTYMDLDAE